MKNKILTIFFILLIIITSTVFATNAQIPEINSDIYGEYENYLLDSEVYGNIFLSSDKFEMSDTASIRGNLFLTCKTAQIKSNVSYSNAISKDGFYAIETVNSNAVINGNVYMICEEFILEPGAEINGDLYIIADKITIQKSSSIYGNLFAISSEIILDGRVDKSVYAISDTFNMNYYGAISNDLHLTSENVTLSSVIRRNAYIVSKTITTNSDFLLYGTLEADSHEFNFSGQIDRDAKINSKNINFINNKDGNKIDCLISGSLNYSSEEKLQIEDGIVKGEINYSEYIEKIDVTHTLKSFVLNLITFAFYLLAVVLVFNLVNKNYKNKKYNITIKNALASFGIGLLSFIIVAVVLILLILVQVGATLSFALLFAYLFLLFMAMPIFILDIALLLKNKCNIYLSTGLIAITLSIISAIPVVGTIVMFIFTITGVRQNL